MKLNFRINEEKRSKVYDERSNIIYNGFMTSDQIMDNLMDEYSQEEIIQIKITSDTEIKTNINQIANTQYKDDDNYVKACRREWDKLWNFFGVEDYKEKLFSKGGGLLLTLHEKDFLEELFKISCRPDKSNWDEINENNKPKSFLNKNKKNYDSDEKEKIQWAASELYQMLRRRVIITNDIRIKFFEATKDKSYIMGEKYDEIYTCIEKTKELVYDDSDDYCLNIREKELWIEGLTNEVLKTINKWKEIFCTMDSLKYNSEDKYQGIMQPEQLLEAAIKDVEKELKL